jgi:hypothetical protein
MQVGLQKKITGLTILRRLVWPKKRSNPQTSLQIYGFDQFKVSARVALSQSLSSFVYFSCTAKFLRVPFFRSSKWCLVYE